MVAIHAVVEIKELFVRILIILKIFVLEEIHIVSVKMITTVAILEVIALGVEAEAIVLVGQETIGLGGSNRITFLLILAFQLVGERLIQLVKTAIALPRVDGPEMLDGMWAIYIDADGSTGRRVEERVVHHKIFP
mmetsp:Transcript_40936/g.46508  ORF Transcript_40936/g.46508 Transcript_40936/m.46508 type:complete len:135 (+) Transcript_40936:1276-1680(+)